MKKIHFGIIAAFMLVSVFSCNDGKQQRPAVSPSPAPAESSTLPGTVESLVSPRPSPASTPAPTPTRPAATPAGSISLDPVAPSANPGTAAQITTGTSLFALNPADRVVARDFEIGPLQDAYSDSRDYLACFKAVQAFFAGLSKKEISEKVILPDALEPIKRSLAYSVEQGMIPEIVRVGKASFSSDTEVRVNVRLYKGEGVTEGEIYLVKKETEWLISDLQLGLGLLREKHQARPAPFVPGEYDFLLEK